MPLFPSDSFEIILRICGNGIRFGGRQCMYAGELTKVIPLLHFKLLKNAIEIPYDSLDYSAHNLLPLVLLSSQDWVFSRAISCPFLLLMGQVDTVYKYSLINSVSVWQWSTCEPTGALLGRCCESQGVDKRSDSSYTY